MIESRLIIVEGIMGSGKSTMSRYLARQIARTEKDSKLFVSEFIPHESSERNRPGFLSFADLLARVDRQPNPTEAVRVLRGRSENWNSFWSTVTPAEISSLSQSSWQDFVRKADSTKAVNVFDGQFFAGDLTALMLLDEPFSKLQKFLDRIIEISKPLNPVIIYLRPAEVDHLLRRTVAVRGPGWAQAQLGKVDAPYCRRRGLAGREGWIKLYENFRLTTDDLFRSLSVPKTQIEMTLGDWKGSKRTARDFLALPHRFDFGFELWRRGRQQFERMAARV